MAFFMTGVPFECSECENVVRIYCKVENVQGLGPAESHVEEEERECEECGEETLHEPRPELIEDE